MEALRRFLHDLSALAGRMSRREKLLVGGTAAGFVLFVGSVVLGQVARSVSRHEASIEEKTSSLAQIAVYARDYAESERTRKELENRLGGPAPSLVTHMQTLADKYGLGIGSMSDRGLNHVGGVDESVVELQIANAPLDKLVGLVNDVEKSPRIVKLRKLRVRRTTGDPKLLNVTLTVTTYSLPQKG